MTATFIIGDTREVTASLADGSVDLILTSPPFLALRSYLPADHPDKGKEIGSEANPAAFIDVLLELSAEWRRILAPHGSLVLELGDSYAGSGGAGGDYNPGGLRDGQQKFKQRTGWHRDGKGDKTIHRVGGVDSGTPNFGNGWPLPKCLALVPELYRIGLAYGLNPLTGAPSPAGRWRVRNVVRWVRPNPPVGALGDKFRPATSDLVIACVAGDRYFDLDAVRTPVQHPEQRLPAKMNRADGKYSGPRIPLPEYDASQSAGAPPLDWWQIVPGGYGGAHYAVWPPALCERPIEAMCPRRVCRTCGKPSRRLTGETEYVSTVGTTPVLNMREGERLAENVNQWKGANGRPGHFVASAPTVGWSSCGCPNSDGLQLDGYHTGQGWRPGLVYDPFAGSGTTLVVAHGHSRDSIGADLDHRNAALAAERLGMFLDVAGA